MYNLLQDKSTSVIKMDTNSLQETLQGRYMYTKGLRFIAEIKQIERYDEEENKESKDTIVTIRHAELFPIGQNFTLSVDIYLKSGENRWESISQSKHVFSKTKKSIELNFADNIDEWSSKSISGDGLSWKFVVSCEENLYEQWNFHELSALSRKIKNDYKTYLDPKSSSSIIENLWKHRTCSDFTFLIDNEEFRVHKNILAVQSRVFKKLFEGDGNSSYVSVLTNSAMINEISAGAFQDFLAYLYIHKIPEFSEHTTDVYRAAEKYEIKDLKIICELLIMENVSCENAIKMLEFGNKHGKEFVKLLALEKVKKYFPKQQLPANIRNHPEMIKDLIEAKSKLKNELTNADNNYRKSLIRTYKKHSKDVNSAKMEYDIKFRGITYNFISK